MTPISIIGILLGSVSAVILIALIGYRLSYNPYAPLTRHTVGDGVTLKVGIMGDTQLIASEDDPYYNYTEHLINAFKVLREQKVEVIVFDGDIGNLGSAYAFNLFKKVFDLTYGGDEEKPIMNIIMGNHDHWYIKSIPSIPTYHEKLFEEALGEKPFSHKVINGYHFINWGSMDSTTITCNANILWAKKEIEAAIKEDPNKPVFVQTHLAPYGTMYGSVEWGNRLITYLLKMARLLAPIHIL